MVSYGDSDFRKWAEENGFDDNDMAIIDRTLRKKRRNRILTFLVAMGLAFILEGMWELPIEGQYPIFETIAHHPEFGEFVGILYFVWYIVTLPLYIECRTYQMIIRQGTFDVRPGGLLAILSLVMFISYIWIVPLIIRIGAKHRLWGTGIRKLIRKGKIGNH